MEAFKANLQKKKKEGAGDSYAKFQAYSARIGTTTVRTAVMLTSGKDNQPHYCFKPNILHETLTVDNPDALGFKKFPASLSKCEVFDMRKDPFGPNVKKFDSEKTQQYPSKVLVFFTQISRDFETVKKIGIALVESLQRLMKQDIFLTLYMETMKV